MLILTSNDTAKMYGGWKYNYTNTNVPPSSCDEVSLQNRFQWKCGRSPTVLNRNSGILISMTGVRRAAWSSSEL